MMKIYTKTGDKGKTQIKDGRVYKNDPIIHIVGMIDELHSSITIIHPKLNLHISTTRHYENTLILSSIREQIIQIQCKLIDLGSYFSGYTAYIPEVELLEEWIDKHQEYLPELKHFLIPVPKTELEGYMHTCRSMTRKLERHLIDEIDKFGDALPYINRLSDYFFTLGRVIAVMLGKEFPVHSVRGKHELLL